MRVNAITSGSSGNCYIIEFSSKNTNYSEDINNYYTSENNDEFENIDDLEQSNEKKYILFDCGITYSSLLKYLEDLDILPEQIQYLIITHEHSDHIKGIDTLLKKNEHIEIITSKSVSALLKLQTLPNRVYEISYSQKLPFNNFDVFSYETSHDCKEAMSFVLIDKQTNKRICFMNDLGEFNDFQVQLAKQSDIIFLESNYDENLVHISTMHTTYLNRLTSSVGHLSNSQAQQLCSKFIHENQTIILSHISENMNMYKTCYEEMRLLIKNLNIKNYKLLISYQNQPTGWIE